MKEDNTPTVTSRRRKLTPHQRIRRDKADELRKLGALTKEKRNKSKEQKPGEADPEKKVSIASRIPKLKRDTLSKPAKPPAKFRKRQIHKSWLPTHLYHAKRARMTPPSEPLWRFAIPLTPTEKSYRLTHRAATLRGCVAWDTSYMATIGVEGVEGSLLGLLKSIGVDQSMLVGRRSAKWRRGTRLWEGWIKERDGEKRSIAKVGIVWKLDSEESEPSKLDEKDKQSPENQEAKNRLSEDLQQNEAEHGPPAKNSPKKARRRLFVRVHPSAFFQTWNEILKVAKIQRPAATVEDLRFEIGSIEVIGPESTQALIGVLHPVETPALATNTTVTGDLDDEWVDIETSKRIWPRLAGITNPASLPSNAVLGLTISDPRLHHPPKTVKPPDDRLNSDALLELMSSWPPDQTEVAYDLFDRSKRLTASRQLSSQKAINRRKGEALPGAYPAPSSKDPEIPSLLMVSRTTNTADQGSWTVLLPWKCVLPVWYSLMHYPLTSGGNPRFGGLQERRQISFEQSIPWYPADYPGTKAGFEWELLERERKKLEWTKRPKGKRTAWESVNVGNGRKGEIGLGWACDWGRLFRGPQLPNVNGESDTTSTQPKQPHKDSAAQPPQNSDTDSTVLSPEQPAKGSSDPPLVMQQHTSPLSSKPPFPATALSTVHLKLLASGHPIRNARLYRPPTTDPELRARWLALANPVKPLKRPSPFRPESRPSNTTFPHQRAQKLAARLTAPPLSSNDAETTPLRAGDPSYPSVPEETDLIGFVTTGNFNLGEGKCEAIGNVVLARVMEKDNLSKEGERNICIVREAGQSLGRLARWKFV